MELVHQCARQGIRAFLIRERGAERELAERELLEAGVPLPLPHRALWAANAYPWKSWFLLMRDPNGHACGGFGIEHIQSRSMPGHVILRVRSFGGDLSLDICRLGLEAATQVARNEPRILKLQINVFSLTGREEIGKILAGLRFRELSPSSSYRYTLAVDLRASEESILASFSKSARNRIRESMKKSLRSVVITDPAYAVRIEALQQEAVRRTGGQIAATDWKGVLRMSRESPDLARVFGLFADDDLVPENMRAFSWACNHGDRGEYRAAGSARNADMRTPFGYILVWDMIRWAKSNGAEWFDMGGVTLDEGEGTALKGISDFKGFFSRRVVEVGAEWVLELSPLRARVADMLAASARRFGRLLR
jgi:hypothetical protein